MSLSKLLHAQRRPHGPLGVVLVGDRGPEEGDDGVTDDLVDLAAIALPHRRPAVGSSSPSTTFLTCSGSLPSESEVNPTRSANSQDVTTRRSSATSVIAWPQWEQTGSVGDGAARQARHSMSRGYETADNGASAERPRAS